MRVAGRVALALLCVTIFAGAANAPATTIPPQRLRTLQVPPAGAPWPGDQRFVVDGNAAWMWSATSVLERVDLTDGVATAVDVPLGPLTAGDDGVWTLGGCPETLSLLARDGSAVVRSFELPVDCQREFAAQPQLSASGPWVWVSVGPRLLRVDATSGAVTAVTLPDGPPGGRSFSAVFEALTAAPDGVWVGYLDHLRYVSAATTTLTSDVTLGGEAEHMLISTVVGLDRGAIWASANAVSGSPVPVASVRLGPDHATWSHAVPVAIVRGGGGHLWYVGYFPRGVSFEHPSRTWQIGELDPRTGRLLTKVDITNQVPGLPPQTAATTDALWVLSGDRLTRIPARATARRR